MMSVDRRLCFLCSEELKASGVSYELMPDREEKCKCEWCRYPRICSKYRIMYGRGRG